ncbi:hypothetical protein PVAND_017512 [Polypedilum vanderplanki]|uniref:BTB domain-containing protein n=1 Tax=Polypedilum vanderplanki TaxID=319348 RepID=A0A9J6BJ98_POLVA|nr:hypothetical protein PVAND_017512 [Polypedilum vanderplanki]
MEIECEFKSMKWYFNQASNEDRYTCFIEGKQFPAEENTAIEFKGTHSQGYTNNNISGLIATNCQLYKIPKTLSVKFTGITRIMFNHCGLKEISNQELRFFPNLYYLNLSHNQLKVLPKYLFQNMANLYYIIISNNKLELIQPDIVDHFSQNIVTFDVSFNSSISTIYTFDGNNRATKKNELKNALKDIYVISMESNKEKLEQELKQKDEEIFQLNLEVAKTVELAKTYEIAAKEDKKDELKALTNTLEKIKPFIHDIETYLEDEDLKDFTVILLNKRIKIHKMILAARSSVFAEMIKNNPDAEELRLTDIPVSTFKKVLNFVYTDIIPNGIEQLTEIYVVAEKLKIKSLENAIVSECLEILSNENVFDLLAFAIKYKIDKLKVKSMQKIQEIFPDKSFKVDLTEQCEELKKFAEAKRTMDEMMKKFTMVD